MLPGGRIRPLAADAGRSEADEERAPLGAANVAGGPVASLLAAVGEVAPANLLGAGAEGGGDGGGVHGAPPAPMTPAAEAGRRFGLGSMQDLSRGCRGDVRVPAPPRLLPAPGRRAVREARALPSGRGRLGIGCKKKGTGPAPGRMRRRPPVEREGGAR